MLKWAIKNIWGLMQMTWFKNWLHETKLSSLEKFRIQINLEKYIQKTSALFLILCQVKWFGSKIKFRAEKLMRQEIITLQ